MGSGQTARYSITMKPFNKSPRYAEFIKWRNLALEGILHKYLTRIDKTIAALQTVTKEIAAYAHIQNQCASPQECIEYLDARLKGAFSYAAEKVWETANQLNTSTYTLAYSGELEAISRSLPTDTIQAKLDKEKLSKAVIQDSTLGGVLIDKFRLSFSKLRRHVLDSIELGLIRKESFADIEDRIDAAFPRQKTIRKPKRKLNKKAEDKARHVTEASPPKKPNSVSGVFGIIDEESWNILVSDFISDEIGPRGPDDIFDIVVSRKKGDVVRYTWEVENLVSQVFVEQVRKGEVDAANDNGITDFVWVSVIDSDTDDCCIWRDGLTTSEIEKQLKGPRSGDKCKVVNPPAHFNCRCLLAPLTDDLPSKPPKPLGDFESWLK